MGNDDDKEDQGKPASRFSRGADRAPRRRPDAPPAGPRAAGLARPPSRPPEHRPPPREEAFDRRPPRDGDAPYFAETGERRPPRGDRPPPRGDRPPFRGERPPFRGDRPGPQGPRPPYRQDGPERAPQHSHAPGPRTAMPPDLVTGAHAVESLVQFKPSRVKEVYLWSGDPRLTARVVALAAESQLRVIREAPPGIDPASPNPQGVAVRVTEFEYADLDQLVPVSGARPGTLVVVLDSITDPRNLGAIVRSAAFFGATAIVLPQDRAAEMTPLVERISEGGSASVPVVRVVNLARTLKMLTDRGVEVVGTALDGTTGDIRDHAFGAATALVLGAEGVGIRPLVRKGCDVLLTMRGPAAMPSLNVAAFATLALALARGAQRD